MRTRFVAGLLLLSLLGGLSGCGNTECREDTRSVPAPQETRKNPEGHGETILTSPSGGNVQDEYVDAVRPEVANEVERILAADLSSVPVARRHLAQRKRAWELWDHLYPERTNNAAYVICAAARLQAILERELTTVRVPERTIQRKPVLRTPEGLYYSVYDFSERDKLDKIAAETAEIHNTKGYLRQMQYFVEDYYYGIDSQLLCNLYRSLDEKARDEVLKRVTSILGRAPRWEKWQRR